MEPPPVLRDRFRDWKWDVAWSHVPELQTWRLDKGRDVSFLKLIDARWEVRGTEEITRLRWARQFLQVPEVLDAGSDGIVDWILTRALPGSNAIDDEWTAEPERLAFALGSGLRRFHTAPAAGCPFDARNETLLELARAKLGVEELSTLEQMRPANEDIVVTHGDACLPNFLLEDWQVTGYVDLGSLGLADRWRDIAVCLWSLGRNLGEGHERAFLDGYGVEPDEGKRVFYEELYLRL